MKNDPSNLSKDQNIILWPHHFLELKEFVVEGGNGILKRIPPFVFQKLRCSLALQKCS